MTATRRIFLRDSALAVVGTGAMPLWLGRAAAGAERKRNKVLVAIFQRGAADGLNIVVPYTDPRYYALRPTIAVDRKDVVDLDGAFGLHPQLAGLKPFWDAKQLAIVHASGSPDPTRSHFDAQDYMESGTPGVKSTRDGWMNRAIPAAQSPSPVRAVSMGPMLPRAMRGASAAVAVNRIGDFKVRDEPSAMPFESMYGGDRAMKNAAKDTFAAVKLLESIEREPYTPGGGAEYPGSRFGQSLKQIARLIKSDAGVEVAFADIGGWDHHVNEANQLNNLLRDFGGTLGAFARDLGERMDDVVLVTMSEFGRTAKENGSRGTDHGHANCMFVLGGGVAGGKLHGAWPGLQPEQLYESRDLAVITDFRAVLGELVTRQLGQADLPKVFPGYSGRPLGLVG